MSEGTNNKEKMMHTRLTPACYDHAKWQQAEPTSRLLPDNDDRQEWCAYGTLDGVPVAAYWLFSPEQVEDAGEESGDLPWELVDHIEVDIYSCDRHDVTVSALEALVDKWGLSPAADMGRRGGLKGGSAKSEAKAKEARANGAKGGRPMTQERLDELRELAQAETDKTKKSKLWARWTAACKRMR